MTCIGPQGLDFVNLLEALRTVECILKGFTIVNYNPSVVIFTLGLKAPSLWHLSDYVATVVITILSCFSYILLTTLVSKYDVILSYSGL